MFNYDSKKLKNFLSVENNNKKFKKDISDLIFLVIVFCVMFAGLTYVKVHTPFLVLVMIVVFLLIIWGLIFRAGIQSEKYHRLFLFKGVSGSILSFCSFGLSLIVYYLYLEFSSPLFLVTLTMFSFVTIGITIILVKRKIAQDINESTKQNSNLVIIATFSTYGVLISTLLTKYFDQNGLYFIVIVAMTLLGYIFEFVSINFLLKYFLAKSIKK